MCISVMSVMDYMRAGEYRQRFVTALKRSIENHAHEANIGSTITVGLVSAPDPTAVDYITATRCSGDVIHPQLRPLGLGPRLPWVLIRNLSSLTSHSPCSYS